MFSDVSYARHQTLGWCLSWDRLSARICKQTLCRKMSVSAICPHTHAVRWTSVSIFRMRRTVAEVETFWNVSGTDCHLVSVTRKRRCYNSVGIAGGCSTFVSMNDVMLPYLEISGVRKWGKGSARYEAGICFMTGNRAAARTLGGGSVTSVSYKCFCTGNSCWAM